MFVANYYSCINEVEVDTILSELSDGRHTITLTVTDAAGNSNSDEISFVVNLDNASETDFTTTPATLGIVGRVVSFTVDNGPMLGGIVILLILGGYFVYTKRIRRKG